MLDLIISTLTQGLIYGLLSCGVYITYKILDFPDLTVDGSFPLGAAVTALLMTNGCSPWLSLVVAAAVGALAGFATGFIHVRLGVRDLLAGIITMTALFSINLQIAGSNLYIDRAIDTIFTLGVLDGVPLYIRKLIVSALLALAAKLLLDVYFATKNGLLLRAVGDNATLVTTLARDKGSMKILGLVIANALVALSGSVLCQEQRAFSATMGTGQVVFGLAAVIIGSTLFKKWPGVRGTTAAIVGSVLYKACVQVAISLGLPANLLKLVTAVLFLAVLVLGDKKQRAPKNAVPAEGLAKGGADRA